MPLTYIQKEKKMREYHDARAMYMQGIPLRTIGKQFGRSYQWALLVAQASGANKPIKALQNMMNLTKRPTDEADEQPR